MPDPIPITCPEWEYESVPNFDLILRSRAKSALDIIRKSQPSQLLTRIKDTRPVHQQFFRDLTPPTTPYYAGNYRGQNILCLKDYQVRIKSDPRVGHHPSLVLSDMATLAVEIEGALRECDLVWTVPNAVFSAAEKLTKIVTVAVAVFVYFLEIHPYANGNGHAAQFILIAALARHGVYISRWQMHPRPSDPPYSDAIVAYRSGNRGPLERFVLGCI